MIFGMGVSMMRPSEMDANDAVKVGASARHFSNNLGICPLNNSNVKGTFKKRDGNSSSLTFDFSSNLP